MCEAFQTKRSARIIAVLTGAVIAVAAAGYLFFIIRTSIRCPASFILLPDCIVRGAVPGGQAILFYIGRFYTAFRYNPMYVTLLPFLGVYIVARLIDWVLTGGNHVDQKINQKVLYVVLVIVVGFGIVRNIPIYPFTLLVPAGY